MTDQTSTSRSARRTRRQLLTGAAGALTAVLTAEALSRPGPASAANGDNVILGQSNTATTMTAITNSTDGDTALFAAATGFGTGLNGTSDSGNGVFGVTHGDGAGVHGQAGSDSGTGVTGVNSGGGNGVFGEANNSSASGVYGLNGGTGFGVAGRAASGFGVLGDSADGVGVWANSQNATALKVTGKAKFSRSGVLAVAAGKSSATQTGVQLSPASLVLATLQQDRSGVWVRSAVPKVSAHSFTVHLSKTVPARTKVAWFVVN